MTQRFRTATYIRFMIGDNPGPRLTEIKQRYLYVRVDPENLSPSVLREFFQFDSRARLYRGIPNPEALIGETKGLPMHRSSDVIANFEWAEDSVRGMGPVGVIIADCVFTALNILAEAVEAFKAGDTALADEKLAKCYQHARDEGFKLAEEFSKIKELHEFLEQAANEAESKAQAADDSARKAKAEIKNVIADMRCEEQDVWSKWIDSSDGTRTHSKNLDNIRSVLASGRDAIRKQIAAWQVHLTPQQEAGAHFEEGALASELSKLNTLVGFLKSYNENGGQTAESVQKAIDSAIASIAEIRELEEMVQEEFDTKKDDLFEHLDKTESEMRTCSKELTKALKQLKKDHQEYLKTKKIRDDHSGAPVYLPYEVGSGNSEFITKDDYNQSLKISRDPQKSPTVRTDEIEGIIRKMRELFDLSMVLPEGVHYILESAEEIIELSKKYLTFEAARAVAPEAESSETATEADSLEDSDTPEPSESDDPVQTATAQPEAESSPVSDTEADEMPVPIVVSTPSEPADEDSPTGCVFTTPHSPEEETAQPVEEDEEEQAASTAEDVPKPVPASSSVPAPVVANLHASVDLLYEYVVLAGWVMTGQKHNYVSCQSLIRLVERARAYIKEALPEIDFPEDKQTLELLEKRIKSADVCRQLVANTTELIPTQVFREWHVEQLPWFHFDCSSKRPKVFKMTKASEALAREIARKRGFDLEKALSEERDRLKGVSTVTAGIRVKAKENKAKKARAKKKAAKAAKKSPKPSELPEKVAKPYPKEAEPKTPQTKKEDADQVNGEKQPLPEEQIESVHDLLICLGFANSEPRKPYALSLSIMLDALTMLKQIKSDQKAELMEALLILIKARSTVVESACQTKSASSREIWYRIHNEVSADLELILSTGQFETARSLLLSLNIEPVTLKLAMNRAQKRAVKALQG